MTFFFFFAFQFFRGCPAQKLAEKMTFSTKKVAKYSNQMLTTGIFPDAFKVAKIIPIFKKVRDSSLLVNYRPISLLPTILKVFERVIHDQMYEYFNNFNLLAEQQYGFRKKNTQQNTPP